MATAHDLDRKRRVIHCGMVTSVGDGALVVGDPFQVIARRMREQIGHVLFLMSSFRSQHAQGAPPAPLEVAICRASACMPNPKLRCMFNLDASSGSRACFDVERAIGAP